MTLTETVYADLLVVKSKYFTMKDVKLEGVAALFDSFVKAQVYVLKKKNYISKAF